MGAVLAGTQRSYWEGRVWDSLCRDLRGTREVSYSHPRADVPLSS